jgi:uncharacterized protein YjiS (DUF1127 family)
MSSQLAVRSSGTAAQGSSMDQALPTRSTPVLLLAPMLLDVRSLSCVPGIAPAPRRSATAVLRAIGGMLAGPARHALRAVIGWRERACERHQLRSLDDRTLRDIGLTRSDVLRL